MAAPLSRRKMAQYIAEQLAAGAEHGKLLRQVAAYLMAHKQTKQVELLLADVADELASGHGTVMAEIISARALSSELKQSIASFVKSEHKAVHIQINESVDPSIIGGVIIKTPGFEFDSSIRTKLNRLRSA